MGYRTAWLIVQSFNRLFVEPVARSTVGGSHGGGVELTEFGADLVRRYRNASRRIDELIESEFAEVASKARRDSGRAPGAPGRRKARARTSTPSS
jgi:molybdate transport system regulatory protein